jgi:hypothetical protein
MTFWMVFLSESYLHVIFIKLSHSEILNKKSKLLSKIMWSHSNGDPLSLENVIQKQGTWLGYLLLSLRDYRYHYHSDNISTENLYYFLRSHNLLSSK